MVQNRFRKVHPLRIYPNIGVLLRCSVLIQAFLEDLEGDLHFHHGEA